MPFDLILFQFLQYNEISRLVEIEKCFSTLYRKRCDLKSRREGDVHSYILLLFMIVVEVVGDGVTLYVITEIL